MEIHLPTLRPRQKEFIKNTKRFNVLVLHRRAGKTLWSILCLITKAIGNKWYYWYIAPTYKQAKNIAFDMLKKYTRDIKGTDVNLTELKIRLFNWSKIQLFWADNPDSLRWLDLKWVIFDEYWQQPSNIYSEIIYPMLVVNNWFAIWIWTPKGKNSFYELYQKARKDDDYLSIYKTVRDTNLLTEQQLMEAKKEMTDEEFEQEFMCSWNASIKWAYYAKEIAKARDEWRIRNWLYDKLLSVYTFWDIWVSDYTAIVFAQIVGQEIRIIDYYQDNWKNFEYYANILKKKGYEYIRHYFPHDIRVREFTTWLSRLEIAQGLFWYDKIEITPSIWLKDWIDALRLIFYKIRIDAKLELLIDVINNYSQERDIKKGMFKDKPKHDWSSHWADAMRYMAVNFKNLTTPNEWATIDEVDYGI